MILLAIIIAALLLLALTSTPGLILALAWVGTGLWMVSRSRSRGWRADLSFVFVWPLHWILER